MNRKELILVSIESILDYLKEASKCIARDEPHNGMCYLTLAGHSLMNTLQNLFILRTNPL